eukprot:4473572-Prymnesium_polylepis.1
MVAFPATMFQPAMTGAEHAPLLAALAALATLATRATAAALANLAAHILLPYRRYRSHIAIPLTNARVLTPGTFVTAMASMYQFESQVSHARARCARSHSITPKPQPSPDTALASVAVLARSLSLRPRRRDLSLCPSSH